jgi:hypothetical protein
MLKMRINKLAQHLIYSTIILAILYYLAMFINFLSYILFVIPFVLWRTSRSCDSRPTDGSRVEGQYLFLPLQLSSCNTDWMASDLRHSIPLRFLYY